MKSKDKTTESKAMSCKGCFKELLLAGAMLLAMAGFITWAIAMPEAMSLPVILCAMLFTGAGLVLVASKVHAAERGVVEAGELAEENGGDPIAPVTKRAKSGCGAAFAWLSVLFVCGLLAWIFSMVGGA